MAKFSGWCLRQSDSFLFFSGRAHVQQQHERVHRACAEIVVPLRTTARKVSKIEAPFLEDPAKTIIFLGSIYCGPLAMETAS